MQSKTDQKIDIDGNCQFMSDLNNNSTMARYNVIIVKGQLQLFSKGIKPNRHFRLKDIKRYFGISGNTETLINKEKDRSNYKNEINKSNINLSNKGGQDDE